MNENEVQNTETVSEETPAVPSETFETVGISEELFNARMDSFDTLLFADLVALAFVGGCLLALIIVEVFKRV